MQRKTNTSEAPNFQHGYTSSVTSRVGAVYNGFSGVSISHSIIFCVVLCIVYHSLIYDI